MKTLIWLVVNSVFAVCVYMGFIQRHEGAYNVAMFMAWFTIVFSVPMLFESTLKAMQAQGRSIPVALNSVFDLSITFVMVWSGAWVTGFFYLIHSAIQQYAWNEVDKMDNKGENDD
jgi:hypothetical protein